MAISEGHGGGEHHIAHKGKQVRRQLAPVAVTEAGGGSGELRNDLPVLLGRSAQGLDTLPVLTRLAEAETKGERELRQLGALGREAADHRGTAGSGESLESGAPGGRYDTGELGPALVHHVGGSEDGYASMGKLEARTAEAANRKTIELLGRVGMRTRTLTLENATEFHGYKAIEEATRGAGASRRRTMRGSGPRTKHQRADPAVFTEAAKYGRSGPAEV
jgi:hypothetical protein